MHILIVASVDTTLLSHQHHRQISNRSTTSKSVCEMRIPPTVNSVSSQFQTATPRRLKHHLSSHFLRSTPLAHRSDEPPDRCWDSIWIRERSFFSRTIGGRIWTVWRREAKFMRCWNPTVSQI